MIYYVNVPNISNDLNLMLRVTLGLGIIVRRGGLALCVSIHRCPVGIC